MTHHFCADCAFGQNKNPDGKPVCICPLEEYPVWSSAPAYFAEITLAGPPKVTGILMLPNEGDSCPAWCPCSEE